MTIFLMLLAVHLLAIVDVLWFQNAHKIHPKEFLYIPGGKFPHFSKSGS
jgi:hypothetical protein